MSAEKPIRRRAFVFGMVFLTASLSVYAAVVEINVDGIASWDLRGDPDNTVLEIDLATALGEPASTEVVVSGLGWDVSITPFGESWYSEAVAVLSDSLGAQVLPFAPGASDEFGGDGVALPYSSGGILLFADFSVEDIVLVDGILRIEFSESFDDVADAIDGTWSGILSVEAVASKPPGPNGLLVIPGTLDFGVVKGSAERSVSVKNNDIEAITVTAIATTDSLLPPYSLISDNCIELVLQPQQSCTITVGFSPVDTSSYVDSFNILSDSVVTPAITVDVEGIGVRTVAVDFMPGECPNEYSIGAEPTVRLAILGSPDFDINRIDRASVRFGSEPPRRSYVADVASPFVPFVGKENPNDCNVLGGDGFPDLVLVFEARRFDVIFSTATVGEVFVLPLKADQRLSIGPGPMVGEDVIVITN